VLAWTAASVPFTALAGGIALASLGIFGSGGGGFLSIDIG